ncbi:hypothetical protein KDA_54330 [Dictyobacter alpinus]|uniref:Glycosyl hydrolase family 13 catalytic domain-containing protein n=1 Tax=Dictyobacter alpinus TaxID=2014873 RepID=A0A402BF36_9CHLR|nr:alpha-amylase family glycosyl hydrolase [Dictyobacter alpinus]GCE29949.1 hypothetical protein KDA_54330 [Dictyobacter alpinus]
MSIQQGTDTALVLYDRYHQLGLQLDPQTGLIQGLLQAGKTLPLRLSVEISTDGNETRSFPFGLTYQDTHQITAVRRTEAAPLYRLDGDQETYTVVTEAENWQLHWHYTFRPRHPRLELWFEIRPLQATEAEPATLRNVHLSLSFQPDDLQNWQFEAPGNAIRPGISATALEKANRVTPIGGVDGSTGLIALHQAEEQQVLVVWPFCRSEIGAISVQAQDDTFQIILNTTLAGRLTASDTLVYRGIELDALTASWEETRDQLASWYTTLQLTTPNDRPAWINTASIFEVQIGYAPFWGGYRYAPYPTVQDLAADLERIKGLGFTAIEIMPRQPYPSYNVHDYADITTSYGDEEQLRTLVQKCHQLGMRVLLDILMHGVIDQEVIAQVADSVRSGPYADRLDDAIFEETLHLEGSDTYLVAWSRHILDFEPHWSGGSLPRHPLADEHPEWFMRDSAQNIIGIYTKAFNVANPAWQQYFCEATETLVRELDIDGFRFDAPTYNDLPDWSTATQKRASYSPLGVLSLFEQLRPRLKALKDDIVLYTEPSGVLFRQALDVTYNYDEHWLVNSVLRSEPGQTDQHIGARNGRELAAWFRDRNAVLPPGSLITHHIDSHDTFWWPNVGKKWRREQFGIEATRALLAIFSLSGGAYMTFIGGEEQLEEQIRLVHRLRAELPEIREGSVCYTAVNVDHEAIYAVVRHQGEQASLLLVNVSNRAIQTNVHLDLHQSGLEHGPYAYHDAWYSPAQSQPIQDLHNIPLSFEPYQVHVLVIRKDQQ